MSKIAWVSLTFMFLGMMVALGYSDYQSNQIKQILVADCIKNNGTWVSVGWSGPHCTN